MHALQMPNTRSDSATGSSANPPPPPPGANGKQVPPAPLKEAPAKPAPAPAKPDPLHVHAEAAPEAIPAAAPAAAAPAAAAPAADGAGPGPQVPPQVPPQFMDANTILQLFQQNQVTVVQALTQHTQDVMTQQQTQFAAPLTNCASKIV